MCEQVVQIVTTDLQTVKYLDVVGRLYITLKELRRAFKISVGNVDNRDFMGVNTCRSKKLF
jgi:hypothetical protein